MSRSGRTQQGWEWVLSVDYPVTRAPVEVRAVSA